jgi:protoheme IX farnesyltransferase
MVREYYRLTKPGIVYGNVLTTLAAYLFASRWHIGFENFIATILGIALVIASACVFNNYFDRDIDKKMARTRSRALASGVVDTSYALMFGVVLGAIGSVLLFFFVNVLTGIVALIGFVVYVFVYTFSKRVTEWATEIGSIAGAAPIVVGYTAVTGRFDLVAFILFLILVFWQMPHFYSIAMFRSNEYALANIPVLPLKKGPHETKIRTLIYLIAFSLAVFTLTFFGYAGYTYALVMGVVTLVWFWRSIEGFSAGDDEAWAKKLFFFSLIVLVTFCITLALTPLLP